MGREEDTTKQKEIDETHLAFIDAIQVFWIIEPCLAFGKKTTGMEISQQAAIMSHKNLC